MAGSLTRIPLDVFLHKTLGGFAPVNQDRQGANYHPDKLQTAMLTLIERHDRIPNGAIVQLAERWGRSAGSLRVTCYYMRRRNRHGYLRKRA